jgi:adenosylhomocysteine nucleosidase
MGTRAISHPDARGRGRLTGVVAALPAEARWLGASALRVRVGGVGAEHAKRAAQVLLAQGAGALVSWGTAAGLTPGLGVGTLVIPDRVISGSEVLVPDESWGARVADALRGVVSVVRGTLACPPSVLRDRHAKAEFAAETGAIAADMESGAIGRVAREAGTPWIVLRVVSDDADTVVPSSVVSAIDRNGTLRFGRLVRALLRRPSDVAAFPALARGMRQAGRTMRAVAPVLEA